MCSNFSNIDKNEICKRIFACIGYMLYQFQCIESLLTTIIGIKKLSTIQKNVDGRRWDHEMIYFEENKTFGNLIVLLKKENWISQEILKDLNEWLEFRNFLVHRYFKNNSTVFYSLNGQMEMLEFLNIKKESLSEFYKKISQFSMEILSFAEAEADVEMMNLLLLNEQHNVDLKKKTNYLKDKETEIIGLKTNNPHCSEQRVIFFITSNEQVLTLGYDGLIISEGYEGEMYPFEISNFNSPQILLSKKSYKEPWNYILNFKSGIKLEVSTHAKGYKIIVK